MQITLGSIKFPSKIAADRYLKLILEKGNGYVVVSHFADGGWVRFTLHVRRVVNRNVSQKNPLLVSNDPVHAPTGYAKLFYKNSFGVPSRPDMHGMFITYF